MEAVVRLNTRTSRARTVTVTLCFYPKVCSFLGFDPAGMLAGRFLRGGGPSWGRLRTFFTTDPAQIRGGP